MPLGVTLKNENKLDEMVDIMAMLHKYVPTMESSKEIPVPGRTEPRHFAIHKFHPILLLGGDQVTVVRPLASQQIRKNSRNFLDQLKGITPVCEDWHARVILLQIS